MRCISVAYIVKPEANLEEVKAAIASFVAAMAAHHPEHRYTSFQVSGNPRAFIHVGELEEEAAAGLTSQAFFRDFSAYLHTQCEDPPKATPLTQVATTTPAA